jgi:3-hydroxyacyl-[acyl-carrier-protein] dehydratase
MEKNNLPDIDEILKLLPHRYPFVLIDKITSMGPGFKITGVKNITYNEWYFQGLPPSLRIVPALILCEAVAQLGSLLVFQEEETRGKLIYFTGIETVRFRKPVRAGDSLQLSGEIVRRKGRVGRFKVEGKVEERIVLEGVMRFAVEQGNGGME